MARAIVTGGAGFIGSHLAQRLLDEGYQVTILDNLSTGSRSNVPANADFVLGDVGCPADLEGLPSEDVRAVFHLAAQSSGEVSFEDPHADLLANTGGTLRLLDWCTRKGIRRFLFTSSMTVYGTEGELPIDESRPCAPKSFYAVAKLAAEQYIRVYAGLGLEPTVLRLFNVYGPGQNLANMKQGMASIFMAYLLRNEPILVKGPLERFRDQTHVADVVEALMRCLGQPASIGRTYNVGTGRKTTVGELISTMIRASGKPADACPVRVVQGTPGDLFGCLADASLIARELGWSCRYSLEAGLRDMYTSYAGSNEYA